LTNHIKYLTILKEHKGVKMSSNNDDKLLTKEEHLSNYIKTFVAIEDAMEPFKEQRKDLRESYNENGWLTKEEMRLAVKAYRLYESETDMEILTDYVNKCQRAVRRMP
jgi:L-fucose isomerase-like protein|tara:strand:+ start:31895 stop:32218 length:324 start_codon:yes stop_codon:yes gene_type:complete